MAQSKLPSFLLTTWLLGTIATKSRVSDFLQSLQEYEIVHPRVISSEHGRSRRSTSERDNANEHLEEPLLIEISNWTLKTVTNNRLMLSPNFTTDWVYFTETRSVAYDEKMDCHLRHGSVEGGKGSLVVVTVCKEEVYALMLTDGKSFFVQPLMDGQHVMYESKNAGWWSTRENTDAVSVRRGNPAGGAFVHTVTSNLYDIVLQTRRVVSQYAVVPVWQKTYNFQNKPYFVGNC